MPGNEAPVRNGSANLDILSPEETPVDETPDEPAAPGTEAVPAPDVLPADDQPAENAPAGDDQSVPAPADEEPAYVTALRQEVEELRTWREEQDARAETQVEERAPAQPQERTPQVWAEIEGRYGFERQKDENGESINVNPRKLIAQIEQMTVWAIQQAEERARGHVFEHVGDMRIDSVMSELQTRKAGPLADIRQYSDGIREFLKKNYKPQDRSNAKHIEVAYYYTKGRNQKNMVKKVQAATERNKTVVRPAAGAGKGAQGPKPLTPEQRHIAQSSGMTDEEYRKLL